MSERLDFLIQTRPEAATAYMTFLKESGRHLDDKTRFLISLVTKVISGANKGLKQYVPHAIRAGASGQELIDAVLMSFPAAGLTKVLNAIEVLQEMNLPELKLENLKRKPQWITLISVNEILENKLTTKNTAGRSFIIYKSDDNIKVYDRQCPHLGNRLPTNIDDHILTCKVHKWSFDLKTGLCIGKATRNLREYNSRINNEMLEVEVIPLD